MINIKNYKPPTKKQTIHRLVKIFISQYLLYLKFEKVQEDAIQILTQFIIKCLHTLSDVQNLSLKAKRLAILQGKYYSNVFHILWNMDACNIKLIPFIAYLQQKKEQQYKFPSFILQRIKEELLQNDDLDSNDQQEQCNNYSKRIYYGQLPYIDEVFTKPEDFTYKNNNMEIEQQEQVPEINQAYYEKQQKLSYSNMIKNEDLFNRVKEKFNSIYLSINPFNKCQKRTNLLELLKK